MSYKQQTEKHVYFFSKETCDGDKSLKMLLGGKGANLAEMAKLGLNIPPGFTIVTKVSDLYYRNNQQIPKEVLDQMWSSLHQLENLTNQKLGDTSKPLFLSVRSGAAVSMPGMMDTILNLGLNSQTVQTLAQQTKNERFAYDSYRRFIHMFGSTVMNIHHHVFSEILENMKKQKDAKHDTQLSTEDLKSLTTQFLQAYKQKVGQEFPEDTKLQLILSIEAVFRSWNSERAIYYRKINDIKGVLGTAVNIQTMVFGNMGETSGTGVAFSRSPSDGENVLTGEFLMNAQGEDVVAGIRTPLPIAKLQSIMPECFKQFSEASTMLEKHFTDMQDMEFTIQEGILYMLQTRNAKRTTTSALKIATDMVFEKLITKEQALLRIEPTTLNQLLHPYVTQKHIDLAKKNGQFLGKGLAASPGAASGVLAFSTSKVIEYNNKGQKAILIRFETSPEDIEGMNIAAGVLTARGGMSSHAAVVARGMGRCCVCGWSDIKEFNEKEGFFSLNDGKSFKQGDLVTIIGTTGDIFTGALSMKDPDITSGALKIYLDWADEIARLKVRTNADVPKDTKKAVDFGAQGIGLCRTEHMFFQKERISQMRQMILANTKEEQSNALARLEEFQKQDFKLLFAYMAGKPVTIRLLDPPLHEFLPKEEADIHEIARNFNISMVDLRKRLSDLEEVNPMLGHRGCRLGITFPEITRMQSRAIFEAVAESPSQVAIPEIMVPLVGFAAELADQKNIIFDEHDKAEKKYNRKIKFLFGTMIEVPRGALMADEMAKDAQFFSFGTNDLTQMTCGFSRDDAGKFLPAYLQKNIIEKDPFQVLDRIGVGQLLKFAVQKGRSVNPHIKLGICGEHGGEPSSIEFCHMIGLDYVSCSPFRVPIARLACAQAQIRHPMEHRIMPALPSAKL